MIVDVFKVCSEEETETKKRKTCSLHKEPVGCISPSQEPHPVFAVIENLTLVKTIFILVAWVRRVFRHLSISTLPAPHMSTTFFCLSSLLTYLLLLFVCYFSVWFKEEFIQDKDTMNGHGLTNKLAACTYRR